VAIRCLDRFPGFPGLVNGHFGVVWKIKAALMYFSLAEGL